MQMIGRHRFLLEGGRMAATVLTTVGIYDLKARRFVPITEMFGMLGHHEAPRPLDPVEAAFLASHRNLRASAKSLEAVH
jgi:hypothetical protein